MKNLRHQIKSSWYYLFWGIATVSVVAGQVYVGSGYREMADELSSINRTIKRATPWATWTINNSKVLE